ncbi:ATP-grasp domain-containing protein [Xenorhabdus griffiniae]|uniref:ATP-grasp domain-containing protein n=1 Tax=Xenorhabdus griffiniae TaxID=351672 RepID=A0ABY9XJ94_9GAMM|nr:ATP-grasp domain-containing protein [Xenorhabdus griffiniae]MBD1228698.1 ATP-grasp domain-containing protein [Xenorhabdus griffiniae]MBE8588304.1 ATP-grasp domain-containing protein [Xenorhabdus griffiniae]WMV73001.1 ATP-grasp domain-containing protein [Xenorhabdus griffiniae]WNH02680.1 ATP-grasp domain-containing protein [Xenorhabdus griffiniae]
MRKILYLGRSEHARHYYSWAQDNGLHVDFFDFPSLTADNHESWAEMINSAHDLYQYDDIISFSDGLQVNVDLLKRITGKPHRDPETIADFTDKVRFRKSLPRLDCIARWYETSELRDSLPARQWVESTVGYPVVIKPSNGFYSTGVTKVSESDLFSKAWSQSRRAGEYFRKLHGHSSIIVEEYIDGKEFAIDGFIKNNCFYPMLFHIKRPDLTGPYFHETAYITMPFCSRKGEEFISIIRDVITATGLNNSPFHAEFRVTDSGQIYLLEIGPRLSGGGVTGQVMMDICCGLDAYHALHHLHDGEPLNYTHRLVGLEYDFCAPRNGVLFDTEKTESLCHELGARVVIKYRDDGDYVMCPPLNSETIITAFFACSDRAGAESIFCELEKHQLGVK